MNLVLNNSEFKGAELRTAFDKVCSEQNVHQGVGPAMAYFQTQEGRRYVYTAFDMAGSYSEGSLINTAESFSVLREGAVETFREWLKPDHTLVWRNYPDVHFDLQSGRWSAYWRCVQLDDNAHSIAIEWTL